MTNWTLDHDSPLLDYADGTKGRAHFTVASLPARPLGEVSGVLAGTACVDITPPPGMPKAGYSSNAQDGQAFRTRLRANITHLRTGTASIAIVQCDLLGGSSVLQRLVARAVADTTDIPLAGLWIGATHTHAAPGQFLGTDFYNRFASNRAGFDPAWCQFLAEQIARGVQEAHDTRAPAKVAIGRTPVWGLTRNRSLDPHVNNANVGDKRQDPQRKFVSVNPDLHLLRVDRVVSGDETEPLVVAVVFAIHGTGVSQHTDEYHADVWGFLRDELGHRVEAATGTRPQVGTSEGTHADVAPALRPGQAGFLEAERIGRRIGAAAARLYADLGRDLTDELDLACGLREIDLDSERRINDVELPDRPAVGAALLAGATENVTPVIHRVAPFAAGHPRKHPTGAQGAKHVVGSRYLQPLLFPKRIFPRILTIQVLRIGATVWVGLPFELTTETGHRLGAATREAAAPHGIEPIVCSVVNGYFGYVTTPEEYARQYYEGGHTLYGPNTQPFLSEHAGRLVGEVLANSPVQDVQPERSWSLKVHRYLAVASPTEAPRVMDGPANFVDPDARHDGYWEAHWLDGPPGGLHWHEPLVRVEASDGGGPWRPAVAHDRVVNDQWWALEVRHDGPTESGVHRYTVRWWDPSFAAGRRHRFVLEANAERPEVIGAPFD